MEGEMKDTKKLLGGRIKDLRKLRSLSQESLAEMVKIDPKHLSRIEVGRGFPSIDALEKLAYVLEVEIGDFFDYHHKSGSPKELRKTIASLIKEMDEEKLRLVAKIVMAIAR